MRNLWIILGVLGIIFVLILVMFVTQLKNVDFSSVASWFNKPDSNVNQLLVDENVNAEDSEYVDENINSEDTEEVEDVGELNYFTIELGRSEADIQSRRTYTFYLPVDIVYELQGVDASSSILLFKKDGQKTFKLTNFDYARSEEEINKYWPDADEYSVEGGHTNILELIDENYEDEMYIFADTLKIDEELVF